MDLEDLSFHLIFSITLRFHDRLASILMKFSSSPNDPKLGSNERYWCKCKLYQVWVDLEDLSFQTLIRSSFEFSIAWLLFWQIFHRAQMIQKWVQMKGTDANVSCTKCEWIWKTWVNQVVQHHSSISWFFFIFNWMIFHEYYFYWTSFCKKSIHAFIKRTEIFAHNLQVYPDSWNMKDMNAIFDHRWLWTALAKT